MSPALIALFAALGVGGWAYSKLVRRTGNSNPQSVALSALALGFFTFIVVFTLLKFTFGW